MYISCHKHMTWILVSNKCHKMNFGLLKPMQPVASSWATNIIRAISFWFIIQFFFIFLALTFFMTLAHTVFSTCIIQPIYFLSAHIIQTTNFSRVRIIQPLFFQPTKSSMRNFLRISKYLPRDSCLCFLPLFVWSRCC